MLFAPKLPTLDGAYLDGWYTDEACTKPFDFSSARMPKGGMTLYARYISTQVEVHIMQKRHYRAGDAAAAQWQQAGRTAQNLRHDQHPETGGLVR